MNESGIIEELILRTDLQITDFENRERLTSGMQAVIYLYTYKGVKVVLKEFEREEEFSLDKYTRSKILVHPNIVRIYNHFKQEPNGFNYIVMEYLDCASLESLKSNICQSREIREIFKQISDGIQYLHSMNIIHRDIKLDNIVQIKNSNKVKIIDLDTLCVNESRYRNFHGIIYITPNLANLPNLHYNHPGNALDYDKSVDIWCLGVLLYELITKKDFLRSIVFQGMPHRLDKEFKGKLKEALNRQIIQLSTLLDSEAPEIDATAKDLLIKMLQKPERRIKIEGVISHPYIRGVKNPASLGFSMNDFKKYKKNINQSLEYHLEHFVELVNVGATWPCSVRDCGTETSDYCRRCGKPCCKTHLRSVKAIKLTKHISKSTKTVKNHLLSNNSDPLDMATIADNQTIKVHNGRLAYSGQQYPYFMKGDRPKVCDESKYDVCPECAKFIDGINNDERHYVKLLGGKKKSTKKKKTYTKVIVGRKRVIHTGPKGGKYYIRIRNGNKVKVYI